MLDEDMDAAAAALLMLNGREPPVDPWALASSMGFTVLDKPGPASTVGVYMSVDGGMPIERQRFDLAHELGHIAAWETGLDAKDCRMASAIAAALLIPDPAIKRDLSRTMWDLAELVPAYGVSWEVMARRLPRVVPCVSTIVDNGRVRWRQRSPWLSGPLRPAPHRLEPWERRLVDAALASGEHCYAANLVSAYVVRRQGWDRVVLVSGVEEWEALTRIPDAASRLPLALAQPA